MTCQKPRKESPILNESIEVWNSLSMLGNEEAALYLRLHSQYASKNNQPSINRFLKTVFKVYAKNKHKYTSFDIFSDKYIIRLIELYDEKNYIYPI